MYQSMIQLRIVLISPKLNKTSSNRPRLQRQCPHKCGTIQKTESNLN